MMIFAVKSVYKRLLPLLFTAVLCSCAADKLNKESVDLFAEGRYEEGIAKLEAAIKNEPKNFSYRTQLINSRDAAIARLINTANGDLAASRLNDAEIGYRRALRIDPTNERAQVGLRAIERDRRHAVLITQAREAYKKGDYDKALLIVQPITIDNPANSDLIMLQRLIDEKQVKDSLNTPTLKSIYKKPVTLEFRDANLKMVFEVLSRTTGINFILDREIKADQKTTLFLKQSSLEDAVDLLLVTNQLEKKVLNENSVLIYPNNTAKLKEYQDLIVKSFYLANADVKQTLNMIKTMLKTKDVYVDERLNLIIMRDTPEAIRVAEKLIAMHDLNEPEVMLEVEVLEVKRSSLLNLGIQYPNQLTLSPLPSQRDTSTITSATGASTTNTTNGQLTVRDLKSLNSGLIGATISNLVINLKKENGTVNILANPRIRARNREKAKILIGDKVPVITTTSTSTGFVSESVQYVDVGLKLEVEPNIYLQDDVAIKVALEVSSIVKEVRSSSGSLSYQIGTRNANTVLRLKDGETQVLAGLISDEDRSSANKIPGFGDLPVVGRLFSSQSDDKQKTEIILSITPHLIRNLVRPGAAGEEFWSGTEATVRTRPLTLQPMLDDGKAPIQPMVIQPSASPVPIPAQPVPLVPPAVSGTPPATQPGIEQLPKTLSFSWEGPVQVKVGDQFRVSARMNSESAIRSLPFQMGFDPGSVQIIDVSEGEFFKQNNGQTNFTSNIDQSEGKIFVGATRSGTEGVKGEGSVVTVTMKAIAVNSQSELRLLSVSPVVVGEPTPAANMPGPYVVAITN